MNAHAGRLDVWLLYRCRDCGLTRKRRLHHRRRPEELGARLAAYRSDRGDDGDTARRHAFEVPLEETLPYRVERPALPAAGPLHARIEQPFPSGARWDRFLAGELGWSRSRVARAWRAGTLRVAGAARPSGRVTCGQELVLELGRPGAPHPPC